MADAIVVYDVNINTKNAESTIKMDSKMRDYETLSRDSNLNEEQSNEG